MKIYKLGSLVLLAHLVFGCVTAPPEEVYNPKVVDAENPSTPEQMSVGQAKRVIADLLQKTQIVSGGSTVSSEISPTQLVVRIVPNADHAYEGPKVHVYVYGSPEGMEVVQEYGAYRAQHQDDFFGNWIDKESAVRFVDAVASLEKFYTTDHSAEAATELAQFKPIAEAYCAKKPRPKLSEDARRFQVQAENAFDEKRYDDAIHDYQRALEIAPWWPDGRYNLAILFGQQESFVEADSEMKKYLMLDPGPGDTRKARDKMYVWEGKLELLTPKAPMPSPTQARKH